jgi:hypothetical protein
MDRIHDPDFDPKMTALVEEQFDCGNSGEAGEVASIADTGNRIEAVVTGGGGVLVFSEVDYPGWRARVDGLPVPVVRADYVLRAVCVPSGQHDVELTFDPPLVKAGAAISTAALLAIVVVWILWLRRRRAAP